jgi:hypothetical protein
VHCASPTGLASCVGGECCTPRALGSASLLRKLDARIEGYPQRAGLCLHRAQRGQARKRTLRMHTHIATPRTRQAARCSRPRQSATPGLSALDSSPQSSVPAIRCRTLQTAQQERMHARRMRPYVRVHMPMRLYAHAEPRVYICASHLSLHLHARLGVFAVRARYRA